MAALAMGGSAHAQITFGGTYNVRTGGSNGNVGTGSSKAWRPIFASRGFGVADPAAGYVVKVYFNNGLVAEKLVAPSAVSRTIGGNPVAQMVTIDEADFASPRAVVVRWDGVS